MRKKIINLSILLLVVVTLIGMIPYAVFAESLPSMEEITIKLNTTTQTAKLYAATDTAHTTDLLSDCKPKSGEYTLQAEVGDYRLYVYNENSESVGSIKLVVAAEGQPTGLGDLSERNHFHVCTASGMKAQNADWVVGTDYTLSVRILPASNGYDREIEPEMLSDGMSVICYEGDNVVMTYCPDETLHPEYMPISQTQTLNWSVGTDKTVIAIPKAVNVSFEVPAYSSLSVGRLHTYFVYDFFDCGTPDTSSADQWIYSVRVPENTDCFYRVNNEQGVTYWNFKKMANGEKITVTSDELHIGDDNFKKDTVLHDFQHNKYDMADIYVNINEQNYKNLALGESFSLNVFRNWMAIESISNAQVALPDMHYAVIDPTTGNNSDVIEVTPDADNSSMATVTAKKEGTAVLLVTYDAMTHMNGMGKSTQFSAIWPENTAVIVFTVGKDGSSVKTNMTINEHWGNTTAVKLAGDRIDAEHDILFYAGNEGATYSFKPESGAEVAIARSTVTDNMSFNGFNSDGIQIAADGTVTLTGLTTGRHIVRVTKDGVSNYQVITAKQIKMTVENMDGKLLMDENGHKNGIIYAGDTVKVIFEGLTNPCEKQSGNYNFNAKPALTDGTNDFGVVTGGAGVYDFSSNTQVCEVKIPADFSGDVYELVGSIGMNGFGSPSGVHRLTDYRTGKPQNFTAVQVHQFLGQIQGVSIPVDKKADVNTVFVIRNAEGDSLENGKITVTYKDTTLESADGAYSLFIADFTVSVEKDGYKRFSATISITEDHLHSLVDGKLYYPVILEALPKGAWDGESKTEPKVDEKGVYLIGSGAELAWFADAVNGGRKTINGKLTANIHLGEKQWTPIGNSSNIYTGEFDGNGYVIEGLYVNSTTGTYIGLFGALGTPGKIMNLGVVGTVVGKERVGGIVGHSANAATIENCFSSVTVTGTKWVGGILGFANNTVIKNCYHIGEVEATGSAGFAGGIASCGTMATMGATISNCYHVGKVTAVKDKTYGAISASTKKNVTTNCYYLEGCANGTNGFGTAKTADELKAIATTLGASFKANTNGYPMLSWQCTNGLGHTPGDAADCTHDQICTVCQAVLTEKLGHTAGDAADCTHDQVCTVCQAVLTEKLGHTPGDAADCTHDQICTVCQTVLTEKLGHTAGDAADCTHDQVCTVCQAVLTEKLGHTAGDAADCTHDQVCTVCQAVLTEKLGHTAGDAADCTHDQVCTVCQTVLTEKLGHTAGDAADCTHDQVCTVCQAVLTEKLGHTAGDAADCTHDQVCTVCQAVLTEKLGHTFENGACTVCGENDHLWLFSDAVEKIAGDMGSAEQYHTICIAVSAYRELNTEEKNKASEKLVTLQAKMNAYNNAVENANKTHEETETTTMSVLGQQMAFLKLVAGAVLSIQKHR